MVLKVGDKAPDFEAIDQEGNIFKLSSLIGRKNIVLYFYPKDFSTGCTIETRQFTSAYKEFKELNAEVIGISADDQNTHKMFAKECGAEFPLLSDADSSIRRLYDVKQTLGLIPARVTYIIDRQGRIAHVFSSQLFPSKHVHEAKRILSELLEKQNKAPDIIG